MENTPRHDFWTAVPKLGFGLMRLPKLPGTSAIDLDQTAQMVDLFLDAGFTYFDTAYVYDDGASEKAVKTTLVDRHPRDTFTLCTKLCAWLQCSGEDSAKRQFFTSLDRTGAGFFDFYLLHAIQRNNAARYDGYRLWDFVRARKAEGLVRRWGFSFHGDPALLESLLDAHPDVDFIQLQINYADWDNPGVASRACHRIALDRGIPVVVMEPVKGGALAHPPAAVRDIFRAADPAASPASWALRYAASLDGILTVLSGMSDLAQMRDNIATMRHFRPVSPAEADLFLRARAALDADPAVPCTGCRYCVGGCPRSIPIPDIFAVRNDVARDPGWDGGKQRYAIATAAGPKASDCIACGRCEAACPQHLPIVSLLRDCRSME
jgi:hypothetical protein